MELHRALPHTMIRTVRTTVALVAMIWLAMVGMVDAQDSQPQWPPLPGLAPAQPLPPPPANLSPSIPVPLTPPGDPGSRLGSGPPALPGGGGAPRGEAPLLPTVPVLPGRQNPAPVTSGAQTPPTSASQSQ